MSIAGTRRDYPATPKDRQGCAKHSDTPTEAPGSVGDFRSSQRLLAKHHRTLEASSVFLMLILESEQERCVAGHMGMDKTMELVDRNFNWPEMAKDIEYYVYSGEDC